MRRFHTNSRSIASTVLVLISSLLFGPARSNAASEEAERLAKSLEVVQALVKAPDDAIPEHILARAEAVVVIPTLVKGGFVVGAQHGKGVMSVRDRAKGTWSLPSFMSLTGGSFGWQIGLQSVDLVLLVMNREGIENLMKSEFKIGADASVAAGPVGRSAEASTDARLGAEILAYSRAKGLFAGATIQGATLKEDDDANRRYYGRSIEPEKLFAGAATIKSPSGANTWRTDLRRLMAQASAEARR